MDQLAEAGVVGEEEGTKPRKVLMSMEQFEEMLSNRAADRLKKMEDNTGMKTDIEIAQEAADAAHQGGGGVLRNCGGRSGTLRKI